ncbi:hypothetical protein KM043_002918 [Ampulex compressa]|nr:hypothetical protein KM043_002918 [Ampulex compressa]
MPFPSGPTLADRMNALDSVSYDNAVESMNGGSGRKGVQPEKRTTMAVGVGVERPRKQNWWFPSRALHELIVPKGLTIVVGQWHPRDYESARKGRQRCSAGFLGVTKKLRNLFTGRKTQKFI